MKAIPPLPVLSLPVGTLRVLHCRGCMPGCMPQTQSQGPRGARAVLPSHSCMNSPVVSVRSLAVFGHVAQVGGFAWVYIGLIWHLLRRWILHACLACAAGGCVCVGSSVTLGWANYLFSAGGGGGWISVVHSRTVGEEFASSHDGPPATGMRPSVGMAIPVTTGCSFRRARYVTVAKTCYMIRRHWVVDTSHMEFHKNKACDVMLVLQCLC